jgi:hypothetical protein
MLIPDPLNLPTRKVVTVLAFLAIFTLTIYSSISLFADGSSFLLTILLKSNFDAFSKGREFAQILTQLPVVAAIKLGINNKLVLVKLYTFGLAGLPLILWFAAIYIQKTTVLFWFFVVAFTSTLLNSGIFAIGEYNITYSLVALSASLLLAKRLTMANAIAVSMLALLLTRAYEAMVFLGVVMYVISIRKAATEGREGSIRFILYMVAFLFAVSVAIALDSIIYPRDPANLNNAGNLLILLNNVQIVYTAGMLLMLLGIWLAPKKISIALSAIALIASMSYLLMPSFWPSPGQYYQARSISGAFLFFILAFAVLVDSSPRIMEFLQARESTRLKSAAFFLFISLVSPYCKDLYGFHQYLTDFYHALKTTKKSEPVNTISAIYQHGMQKFIWAWTNPSMSLIMRRDSSRNLILNPSWYRGWQPFKPENAPHLPNKYY